MSDSAATAAAGPVGNPTAGSSRPMASTGQSTASYQRGSRPQESGAYTGPNAPSVAGLVRPKRRVIKPEASRTSVSTSMDIKRNYGVASGVEFTNFKELRADSMSPDFAQSVLEEVFTECDLDFGNPKAMKMAEDVVFTHYILNAASAKTAHDVVVDVYGKELDLMVLLRRIVAHEQTPRRFTRGLADRLYDFIREPENEPLRVEIAAKHLIEDPGHAIVAFDGSTHVSNLPTHLRSVANMMASRGIYDTMASAKNASEQATYEGVVNSAAVGNSVSGMARR